jgi:hypothetical protein
MVPKKVVLRIFIVLENTPSSAGFEPANFVSNDKEFNHWACEGDCMGSKIQSVLRSKIFVGSLILIVKLTSFKFTTYITTNMYINRSRC